LKLKKGTKPMDLNIPMGTKYTVMRMGDYIEIDITNPGQITRLRNMGFVDI